MSVKILHWLPRVLCIMAILFVSMFAFDAFGPGLSLWVQIGHFIQHLVPSFVLIALLLVAWKWEKIGGIVFLLVGLGFSPFIFLLNYNRNHFSLGNSLLVVLIVSLPFALVGVLFLVSDRLKKARR